MLNLAARKNIGYGIASIGAGLFVLTHYAVTMISLELIIKGQFLFYLITVPAACVIIFFWAGGRLIALAFAKEDERRVTKPEAPAHT